jgi:GTP-binding protein
MAAIIKTVATAPEPRIPAAPKRTKLPVHSAGLAVERRPFGYVVSGDRVERLLERTDLESEGALARFQSVLDQIGVNAALEAAGVQPGDTVRIADVEFEYQP